MDIYNNMIIVKEKIKTKDIRSCQYNNQTGKYEITFNNGKTYSYAHHNVVWLENPKILNPELYHINLDGHELFDIRSISVFQNEDQEYWHICFGDGSERDYYGNELHISKSCHNDSASKDVFEYLKQIASLSNLKNDDGERLLEKQYEKMNFVGEDTALSMYLNPKNRDVGRSEEEVIPIFPFGCNKSQYEECNGEFP